MLENIFEVDRISRNALCMAKYTTAYPSRKIIGNAMILV